MVVALLGACALAFLLLASAPAPAGAATSCANADAGPGEATRGELRTAITCLINERRERRDLKRLDPNRKLKSVAQDHAEVMVATDCFLHRCPGENTVLGRLKDAGYIDDGDSFRFAELLGYAATPLDMVKLWMEKDSGFTRRNILRASFRDIGAGVEEGAPVEGEPDSAFLTFSVLLAWRQ
jgi:uncharacterized protein YkwD